MPEAVGFGGFIDAAAGSMVSEVERRVQAVLTELLFPGPVDGLSSDASHASSTCIDTMAPRFGSRAYPMTGEIRLRHRFTIVTAVITVALLAWGAFVTSINAGLAVPDWPSSFNSYDPFNPWPEWWTITPVLAEHGHRLLGALTGTFTLVLAIWTWVADARRWMKILAVGVLILVSIQGVLGGMRVVLLSLDLAVVHACVAQIYFALIVGMVFFTSRPWLSGETGSYQEADVPGLRRYTLMTGGLLYVQIILGALLRHPGTGIDSVLAGLHIAGAVVVSSAVILLWTFVRRHFRRAHVAIRSAHTMIALLILQVALGVTAYVVTIDDGGFLEPSNLQVVVNTTHMVTGALLVGACAVLVYEAFRLDPGVDSSAHAPARNSRILNEPTLSS